MPLSVMLLVLTSLLETVAEAVWKMSTMAMKRSLRLAEKSVAELMQSLWEPVADLMQSLWEPE